MKQKKKAASQSSARVVDGKLILSLPTAQTPVVWQMDLDQAKASALEVRTNEENGTFILALKTPRGNADDIAVYDNKEEAVEGLLAASAALENAHGQIRPVSAGDTKAVNTNTPPAQKQKSGAWKKWLIAILVLFGLWFLFNLTTIILPKSPNSIVATSSNQAASSEAARQSQGVPVSADDFLAQ